MVPLLLSLVYSLNLLGNALWRIIKIMEYNDVTHYTFIYPPPPFGNEFNQ